MNKKMKKKMRIRGLFLIAILIGGTFQLSYSVNNTTEKEFATLFDPMNSVISSLTFTIPSALASNSKTWIVDDEEEINAFLHFLKSHKIQQLKPDEIDVNDTISQFSISLEDEQGNEFTVIVEEELIIENNMLYYKIVDGPLDVDWLVHFFIQNQL
ncbi:hypothetical protein FITA111629_06375 [Filibacter tadaridae]|uniref:Uncharacterized protein n=1 Tax=Filibacter tadaridae TaxID=2483811 RepID=A0A3P5XFC4_9BACL|nr:hypothetical protein [Filibacter tadaridae]VDC33516.1 hypothetical protein FILTAD_02926 [Filibacter tadaridae]